MGRKEVFATEDSGNILIYKGHLEKQIKKSFNRKGRKRTVHQEQMQMMQKHTLKCLSSQ